MTVVLFFRVFKDNSKRQFLSFFYRLVYALFWYFLPSANALDIHPYQFRLFAPPRFDFELVRTVIELCVAAGSLSSKSSKHSSAWKPKISKSRWQVFFCSDSLRGSLTASWTKSPISKLMTIAVCGGSLHAIKFTASTDQIWKSIEKCLTSYWSQHNFGIYKTMLTTITPELNLSLKFCISWSKKFPVFNTTQWIIIWIRTMRTRGRHPRILNVKL